MGVEGAEFEINPGGMLVDPEFLGAEELATLSVSDIEVIVANQADSPLEVLDLLSRLPEDLKREYVKRGAQGLPDELREDLDG
jgi:hypothetical protein